MTCPPAERANAVMYSTASGSDLFLVMNRIILTSRSEFPEHAERDIQDDYEISHSRAAQMPGLVSPHKTGVGKTHKAGQMSVSAKRADARRSGMSDADMWNVLVQWRAVSRETYNVGANNRTANTDRGTSAARVPSLQASSGAISRGKVRGGDPLDYLGRDEGVTEQ